MAHLIEINDLSFGYPEGKSVLNNIFGTIDSGQLITLLGPNGVGKSTLLNCISGLLKPTCGAVHIDGKSVSAMSRKEIAKYIAYVSQKPNVSFDYTVIEFVVMGCTAHLGTFALPAKEDYQKAERALERLGVESLKDRPISRLSGGEQQKVCIARAIVQDPKLVILDEPTSALDFGNQARVLKLIKELSESGYSVLLTTHNPEHPLLLGSDVWVLNQAGTLRIGSLGDTINEEKLTELYSTEIKVLDVNSVKRKVCLIPSL